jgi:hypothetical protein
MKTNICHQEVNMVEIDLHFKLLKITTFIFRSISIVIVVVVVGPPTKEDHGPMFLEMFVRAFIRSCVRSSVNPSC